MKTPLLVAALLISDLLFGQITIKGTVRNTDDSIIVFKETGGFTNITRTWRDKRYTAPIDKNNRFAIILPEQDINRWLIETSEGYQFFDLIKGKNVELLADFSKANPLTAVGNNADDFNYLTYAIGRNKPNDVYWKGIGRKNIDSVLMIRKRIAADQIANLDGYKHAHHMSDVYYKWIKSKYEYEPYERTSVEDIRNSDSISDAVLSKLLDRGIDDDYAAVNTLEYNDLVGVYMSKKFADAKVASAPKPYFSFAAHSLRGKTLDVFLTRFAASAARTSDSIYGPIYKQYCEIVKDTILQKYIIKERNDYLASLKRKMESITQYASLNGIFSKYIGKVIYVDFWASWCVPCRSEMPRAADLKNRLKTKDVVFVYLGYKDAEQAWLKARKDLDIDGEHYLLNDKLTKEAERAFDISGIPHYVIINKAGDIVNKHAGRPGDVYEYLYKLLGEN